jgi:predicted Zn-dependent protease
LGSKVQTHDYSVVNLLGVMKHEIGHIIGLTHSRDKFSIMHPNYWSWLNTIDEDDTSEGLEKRSLDSREYLV